MSWSEFSSGLLRMLVLFISLASITRTRLLHAVRSRWLAVTSFLLLLSAVYVIFRPYRPYPHYLLFSIVPLSCCLAGGLALLRRMNFWKLRETLLSVVFAALVFLPALKVAITAPNRFVNNLKHNLTRPRTEPIAAIARYAPPGERITVWGWMPEYYVHTATIMATRDAHTALLIFSVPYTEYFRQR